MGRSAVLVTSRAAIDEVFSQYATHKYRSLILVYTYRREVVFILENGRRFAAKRPKGKLDSWLISAVTTTLKAGGINWDAPGWHMDYRKDHSRSGSYLVDVWQPK